MYRAEPSAPEEDLQIASVAMVGPLAFHPKNPETNLPWKWVEMGGEGDPGNSSDS